MRIMTIAERWVSLPSSPPLPLFDRFDHINKGFMVWRRIDYHTRLPHTQATHVDSIIQHESHLLP